jgi:hypothetical protein
MFLKERDLTGKGVDWRIILKWILNKRGIRMWTGDI